MLVNDEPSQWLGVARHPIRKTSKEERHGMINADKMTGPDERSEVHHNLI
jgi:hypothetical protein